MWTRGEKVPPLEINESTEGAASTNPPPPPPPSSSSSSVQIAETCEDNSSQLIDYETIMLKNQMDLKKKEQEVQEYVEKLTKIKSKVKLSRRSVDNSSVGPSDSVSSKKPDDGNDDNADDGGDENDDLNISDEKAKTPKARSHLLQKKLAENRRIFQQRNKEMFESTRAVEEKVEKIKLQISESAEKDKKNIELNEKIHELQATIIDLQDNLKEKDSVIDSKTRAITLMSEDLSRKGKSTLDALEETKSEMRLMQENFIQSELSLKTKIDHLVNQLTEKEHNLETLQRENESMSLINAQKEEKINELETKTQELVNLIDSKKIEESANEENEKNLKVLKQELEESNKNMIKMKSQHKNKLRNLQKRLESFRTMSDTHAEVMRLENQVALLEEEKASNEELQRRLNELENQTVTQTNEIQKHIEAIAALENQKLDLIQELHEVKQEMTALENENSESENLRVTAELKIVELEEQLEKLNSKKMVDDDNTILIDDSVESGNNGGIDKKSTESTGSSESFERITDVGDGGNAHLTGEIARLNEKISILTDENSELVITLTKLQERMSEAEKSRDEIEQLKIENDKLLDDNHKNVIDNQTLMSLEAEIVNLKQLLNEKHEENEKLMNDSILNRENIHSLQADLAGTISALQSKLIDEHANIESLKKVIDEKTQLINELELEKSQNDEKLKQSEMERSKLNELIEEKIRLHNNLEQELLQKIEKLEIEVENRNVIIENLKEESIKIHTEFERMGNFTAECSSEQANQAALIERLGAQNEELTLINANLNREINDLKENITKTMDKIEDIQLKCDEYIREINEKNVIITEFELKLNNVNEEYSVNVDSLERKFTEMNLDLDEKNKRLNQVIIELEGQIENFQSELQRKDEILNELMAKNTEISMNNEALRENINELTYELNNLNAKIVEKDEMIMKKVEEVTNLDNELKVESDKNIKQLLLLEQSNKDLEDKWQEMKMKYEEKSNSYEDLLIQIENQSTSHEEIKQELSNSYKTLEQLKMKHQEDVDMLNQRFENLITDLNEKMKETDELKIIIDRQEKIIDSNLTLATKNSLEEQISFLQRDLEDANTNTQAQLHKMKIIAANLKKKSAQCQELEIKLRETEEKWTLEKQEKDILNEKYQSLDKIKMENDEMLKKLELDLDNAELEIQNGRKAYEDLLVEHENYIEKSSMEIAEKDRELMEVKEKARELDVRMQVMEAEYLEQLNTIHRSETDHRLLLSKLSQVNESLESTRSESAELRNSQENLRAEIAEVKKEKDIEVNEKTKVINDLINERDANAIKIEELTIELEKIRSENEELRNKHQELIQQIELLTTNQNIEKNESNLSIPQVEKTTEVLFNAAQCFGTSLNMDMGENNEISNLKKLLDTQKNQQKMLESENERLNSELDSLKMHLSDSVAKCDENNVKIEHYVCHDDVESHEEMKLDDEWIWNANEAEHPHNIQQLQPFSSKETQLNAKIAELEDTMKDMTDEKLRLSEELKLIQIKNGKLIRKLKEYKVQSESLQQQLKIQLSSGGLSDLDSAIEEELRAQVSRLEENLIKIKNENEKITLERDQCTKKIDVLIAANERFVDMKERQDRDLEVMHIRNNELMKKIELLEMKVDGDEEKLHPDSNVKATEAAIDDEECKVCLGKISELRENVEMLAVENDELRKLIETERQELVNIKHKVDVDKKESAEELKSGFYDMLEKSHNLEKQCLDTLEETNLDKDSLEKNYQTNIMEASDKIRELQNDILQKETMINNLEVTIEKFEMNLNEKIEKLNEANQKIGDIEVNLKDEIASRQMTIQTLEKLVEDSQINLNEKIQQLVEANKKISDIELDLENEREAKKREIEIMEATHDDLSINLNKLTEELSIARKEMQNMEITLNNEIAMKQMEINTLEENLIINRDKLNEQTEISAELQRQLEEMKENLGINIEKYQEFGKKCMEDLEGKNQESITAKLEHELLVTRADEKIQELDNRILETSNELAEKDSTLKIMEVNLETALKEGEKWQTDYKEIEQKLAEVNENLGTVTELLNVRVQEVADLKQYIQKLEFNKLDLENCNMNVENLNRQLIAKDNELILINSKYEIQLDEKLKEISNLQSEILALTSQCEESKTKLNNQAQEIDSLKASVNNSELLITTLTTQISSNNENISQLEMEIMSSKNEIQRLSAVIAELETSNLQIRTDLDAKQIELNEKNEEINKLQSNLTENISNRQHENDEHKLIEKQLNEQLSAKNEEIDDFKYILDASTYPLIIQQLQDKIDQLYEEKSQLAQSLSSNTKNSSESQLENVKVPEQSDIVIKNSNELDVALYMLHQRDVKCEELTHELMQLLEERDTLQLRLSNAIRVNEELRRLSNVATTKHEHIVSDGDSMTENRLTTDGSDTQATLSTIQPADSEEGTKLLTQKLSQLRNVGHRRDIRLLDDRELRNTQQMSLIAHKDALSTLPPDAAARLINANYTLSRDVQSQSSVLLNWLWGKSTPKVVDM